MTIRDLAQEINQEYHTTQKVIKRAKYKRSDGSFGVRSNIAVEDGVAKFLGLTHSQVWGKDASRHVKKLIRKEIAAQVKQQGKQLSEQYLLDANCNNHQV